MVRKLTFNTVKKVEAMCGVLVVWEQCCGNVTEAKLR